MRNKIVIILVAACVVLGFSALSFADSIPPGLMVKKIGPEKAVDQKIPFILLYEDENDWYDLLPFNTKESMKQFVTDHTK